MGFSFSALVGFIVATALVLQSSAIDTHYRYDNVGATGTYPRVMNMIPNSGVWNDCPPVNCFKTDVSISGPLAPFNEEQTLALRGPMQVYNFAVYYPTNNADASWQQFAYWDNTNTNNNNVAWMVNRGASENGGEWSICHGNSQTFLSADGSGAASTPQQFTGTLASDLNVNIMSTQRCTNGTTCPWFYRSVPQVGFAGDNCGTKMFAVKVTMPTDYTPTANTNLPALWFLNGQIVRANQWGCNCRGIGAQGGCGELDIAEAISDPSKTDQMLITQLYHFDSTKSKGTAGVFSRPTTTAATFLTIFDGSGAGKIHILKLGATEFPFSSSLLSQAQVSAWTTHTPDEIVTLPNPYTGAQCSATPTTTSPTNTPSTSLPGSTTSTTGTTTQPTTLPPHTSGGVAAWSGVTSLFLLSLFLIFV